MIGGIDDFRDRIRAAGLTPPKQVIADGKLHRFPCNGKRGDDAGWYVFHSDGILAGAFGDWRSGLSETWRANIGRKLSPLEATAHAERVEKMRREREAEEARLHAEAREHAARLWAEAKPADPAHPYLVRKGVQPHGIREKDGLLLVPMRDTEGALWNVERIPAEPGAKKKGLFGGRREGYYFSIGNPNGAIYVGEGYATGASIHEATGHAVAVSFNAGNLRGRERPHWSTTVDGRFWPIAASKPTAASDPQPSFNSLESGHTRDTG